MSGDPRIGMTLAGYRIESVVGRGGMGVVYLAEHLRLGRKAALKVLPPELAEDERFRDRFIHESKLAASLDHPNIVDIYDAGEADGLLYLAMRYVGGSDLKTLLARERPLEPSRAVALLTQIASALDAAHERGLVHRDIKSANALVEPAAGSLGEHAYLTDFGLTKRPESMSGLTKTGQFLGSVEYAAPEQFEGRPIDARTDIYSLGCVAYECLTGEVPFPRDTEAAVMYAHLRDAPPKVTAKRPELPAGLDSVVAKAMAKDPKDRYESAGALANDLRDPPRSTVLAPRRGGRRSILAAAVAAAVVAAVVIAFAMTRGGAGGGNGALTHNPTGRTFVGMLRLDPEGNIAKRIPIDLSPSDVPFDKTVVVEGGSVWLFDGQTSLIYKISPSGNAVVGTPISVRGANTVVGGSGSLWVVPDFFLSGGQELGLVRIDPTTNAPAKRIDTPPGCCRAAAFGDGSVWMISQGKVLRADAATNRITSIPVSGQDIAATKGTVWVLDTVIGRLVPIDAKTNKVGTPIPVSGDPTAVAAGGGAVWVAGSDGNVSKISPGGGIDSVNLPGEKPALTDIFFDASGVWVAAAKEGKVWRLDPDAPDVRPESFAVGGIPTHLALGEGGVWVAAEPPSDIWSN